MPVVGVCAVTVEEKRINEGIWRCLRDHIDSHGLEVAVEHNGKQAQPFWLEYTVLVVNEPSVYDRNGDKLPCGCMERAEVGWECGTD